MGRFTLAIIVWGILVIFTNSALAGAPAGKPAFRCWAQDAMTRIFPTQPAPRRAKTGIVLHAAKREVESFQIGICGTPEGLNDLHAEASVLIGENGATIDPVHIEILYEDTVPVHWHSPGNTPDDLEGTAPGFYPDPLQKTLWRGVGPERVQFPGTVGIWVNVRVPMDAVAGTYRGTVQVSCTGGKGTTKVELRVWPFVLPERSHLLMSNWLLMGEMLNFHKVEPMTDEFWQLLELYARNLADHRQTVITVPFLPMGTKQEFLRDGRIQSQLVDIVQAVPGQYTFDFTNFDRYADIFLRHGFQLLEGQPLAEGSERPYVQFVRRPGEKEIAELPSFTSTGDPAYRAFLGQFLTALRDHLREKGWLDKYVQHISDEPGGDQFDTYTSLVKFVREKAPELKLLDAMLNAKYAPYVDYPVPVEDRYERILATSGKPRDQVWFYYCCWPPGPWPNRMIDYPLIRTRIFTWVAFRYGIPGFLHWGLNCWRWSEPIYHEEAYDPYDNTTGGSLPPGDSFILYPPRMPSKSQEPVNSIRWETVRDAMEDYEYLYLLRELVDAGHGDAADLKRGKALLRELEEKVVPNMTGYTRDAAYLADFRIRVGDTIARLSHATP